MNAKLPILLLFLPLAALRAEDASRVIRLDPASPGRVFEVIGAVSAGTSSRLLLDSPEPQRAECTPTSHTPH